MTTHKEALTLLVEALSLYETRTDGLVNKALAAGKEALAQPEQELTNLERHERNVQQLFGTPQPKEPEREPVAHVCVFPLRGDEFFPQTRIEWKNGRPVAGPLYTTPPQRKPLTDEMVLAGARALAKRHADSCGLDFDDVWKYYAEEHKDDAKAVIEAAHGIKGDA